MVGGASDSAQEVPWAKHRVCCSVTSATYLQNTHNQSITWGGTNTTGSHVWNTDKAPQVHARGHRRQEHWKKQARGPSLVGAALRKATKEAKQKAARTVPGPRSWSNTPRGSKAAGRAPAGSAYPDAAHWRCGHSASTAPGTAQDKSYSTSRGQDVVTSAALQHTTDYIVGPGPDARSKSRQRQWTLWCWNELHNPTPMGRGASRGSRPPTLPPTT